MNKSALTSAAPSRSRQNLLVLRSVGDSLQRMARLKAGCGCWPEGMAAAINLFVPALIDPDFANAEGLGSVAFSPDYESSRLFYVIFTNNDGDIEIN